MFGYCTTRERERERESEREREEGGKELVCWEVEKPVRRRCDSAEDGQAAAPTCSSVGDVDQSAAGWRTNQLISILLE